MNGMWHQGLTVNDQSRSTLAGEESEPPYNASLSKRLDGPELLEGNVVFDFLGNLGSKKEELFLDDLLPESIGGICVDPPERSVGELAVVS